jgi:hypothetical protein
MSYPKDDPETARMYEARLTLLVLKLPKDHVQGAHLGLEWLHQLGADKHLVLIRSVLRRQSHSRLRHVVEVQSGGKGK